MLREVAIGLALVGLSYAQDDTTTPTVPDTDPRPTSVDSNTIPTFLPTLTITDNILTGSAPSLTDIIVTATGVACIPPGEQIFSIQTDTVLETGPLTVTPICGESVTPTGTETGSQTTQVVITGGGGNATGTGGQTTQLIITGGGGNATVGTATNGTVVLTTSLSGTGSGLTTLTATVGGDGSTPTAGGAATGGAETSQPATQSDSSAGRVVVGGAAAGLLGLAAGVFWL